MTISGSGSNQHWMRTRESLTSNYLVALIIVYLAPWSPFQPLGLPAVIMTTIPLA